MARLKQLETIAVLAKNKYQIHTMLNYVIWLGNIGIDIPEVAVNPELLSARDIIAIEKSLIAKFKYLPGCQCGHVAKNHRSGMCKILSCDCRKYVSRKFE
jgi:hypothetical protein